MMGFPLGPGDGDGFSSAAEPMPVHALSKNADPNIRRKFIFISSTPKGCKQQELGSVSSRCGNPTFKK
jgi:hypothetical protein